MITISSVSKAHGPRTLFNDVTFRLDPKRRIALVGGNGVGKTTLLEIIVGDQEPDSGSVQRPKEDRIGYLPQELTVARTGSVLDEVMSGADHIAALGKELERLTELMAAADADGFDDVIEQYGDAQSRYEQLGGYGLESEARRILSGLGFREDDADRPFRELSGGWQMRAALGRLLLSAPDVMILDEPTNHLDTDTIGWLEEQLLNYEGAVFFVSHDRDFIDNIATHVIELAGGTATEYRGGFAEFVVAREEKLASILAAAAHQQRQFDQANQFIERFRYKASKARQVQSRIKTLRKLEKVVVPTKEAVMARFSFPEPPRSSRTVIEVENVTAGYDGVAVLRDVSLVVERGHKISLVGPNGGGKSTLLKTMLGELPPISGTSTLGNNVDVAYFAQHQVDTLDLEATVLAEFLSSVTTERLMGRNARSVLGSFGFTGEASDRKIYELSGGERTRLALAMCMAVPVNLLILDEPTNHLDLPSCDLLEDALLAYPGTVILVSHDRHLIRSVANDLLVVRGGKVSLHHGVDDDIISPSFSGATAGPLSAQQPIASELAKTNGSVDSSASDVNNKNGTKSRAKKANKKSSSRVSSNSTAKVSSGRNKRDSQKKVDRIEKQLANAEQVVAELNDQIALPENYSDREKIVLLSVELGEAQNAVDELFESWTNAQTALENSD